MVSPISFLRSLTLPAPFPRRRVVDLLVVAAVVALAAVIRYRWLMMVPRFTDESEEIQFALKIARGGYWPLVSVDTYNGPLIHYLLSFGLRLVGDPRLPWLTVWAFGALTVGATYGLGLSLSAGRRMVALVAASLMAVSFIPIVVNSHLAWSSSTTPFWTTMFLIAVSETHRRVRPRWLLAAALLGGLAQQTHPSVVAIRSARASF